VRLEANRPVLSIQYVYPGVRQNERAARQSAPIIVPSPSTIIDSIGEKTSPPMRAWIYKRMLRDLG